MQFFELIYTLEMSLYTAGAVAGLLACLVGAFAAITSR